MSGLGAGRRVHVLLVGMPPLLRDIIAAVVAAQPDLEIVHDGTVDVVVMELPDDVSPMDFAVLMKDRLNAAVLGIAPSGKRAVLCEAAIRTSELGELSPGALVETIRRTAWPRTVQDCSR